MLNPQARSLYTAALTPPPGFVFDEAIGTTFSLDPAVLLTVPVHLALLGGNRVRDHLSVLGAIQRLAHRITVYAQRGRLQVPSPPNPLFGLLETMTIEVNAPRGGVFHPKLWLLRFSDPTGEEPALLRLLVLSRNLTLDRCWDVSLMLEGHLTRRNVARNRPLGELFAALPSWAVGQVEAARVEQAERLAQEFRQTDWELPPGYDEVAFHVFGTRARRWSVPASNRAVVISPFCKDEALQHICREARNVDALITRPEALLELSPGTRDRFRRILALHEAAETEDGEEAGQTTRDTFGLHAKVYLFECGWNTHLFLGSANATNAALLAGSNLEVLVELIGKRSKVGGVEGLLGPEGLGEVLVEVPPPDPATVDLDAKAAEQALDAARRMLCDRDLALVCSAEGDDTWRLELTGLGPPLEQVSHAQAWPITVRQEHAVDLWPAAASQPVVFARLATASITGMLAFEFRVLDQTLRFVLNLPVEGLPEARGAAIIQAVVRNRVGFLRYLLLLLGDLGQAGDTGEDGAGGAFGTWTEGRPSEPSILEELVRAYSHNPERLREVGRAIDVLTSGGLPDTNGMVSPELLALWQVFQKAQDHE